MSRSWHNRSRPKDDDYVVEWRRRRDNFRTGTARTFDEVFVAGAGVPRREKMVTIADPPAPERSWGWGLIRMSPKVRTSSLSTVAKLWRDYKASKSAA